MTILIFTRHGETTYNTGRLITGRGADPALTEKGVEDSFNLANKLELEWGDKIDLIVSSAMLRTNQTAEIINTKLSKKMDYDINLQEIYHGDFEGKYGPDYYHILDQSPDDVHPAGGESRLEFQSRVANSMCKYFYHENDTILIVSHGWTGSVAHKYFLESERKHIGNSEIIVFDPNNINNLPGKCESFISSDV